MVDTMKDVRYYQYHTYQPYNATFKNNDEIRIPVNSQELYTVPGESRLYIEGKWAGHRRAGVDAAAPRSTISWSNNAFAFLFDQIRYEVNGVEVDKMKMLGITSTVKTLLTNTDEECRALELGGFTGLFIDEANATFYGLVPLSMLLGFADDFKGVLIRVRQELILVRSRTDKNVWKYNEHPENDDVAITLTKVQWMMPHVKFNLGPEKNILDKVKANTSLQLKFRTWEVHANPQLPKSSKEVWKLMTTTNVKAPSHIIVVLQTNRMDNDRVSSAEFDHVKLRSIRVGLNSVTLPYELMNEDFDKNKFLNFYLNYISFITDYSNGEKLCEPFLKPEDFKSNHPIFVIKCLYEDIIKPGPLDIQIELEAHQNFPDNTAAYAILIHDVIYSYQSLTGIVKRIQ